MTGAYRRFYSFLYHEQIDPGLVRPTVRNEMVRLFVLIVWQCLCVFFYVCKNKSIGSVDVHRRTVYSATRITSVDYHDSRRARSQCESQVPYSSTIL